MTVRCCRAEGSVATWASTARGAGRDPIAVCGGSGLSEGFQLGQSVGSEGCSWSVLVPPGCGCRWPAAWGWDVLSCFPFAAQKSEELLQPQVLTGLPQKPVWFGELFHTTLTLLLVERMKAENAAS